MKSKEQHRLEGTYQKCRHEDRGITVAKVQGLSRPKSLKNKQTKDAWETIVPQLCENQLVTLVDGPELEHAFYCYDKAMECRKQLESFADMPTYYKSLKFHEKDLTAEYRRWMAAWEKVMYKFGITPVEASRVRTNVKKDGDDLADELIKQLTGNG